MKLKRLDIHGFKSFYHRTTIAFDEGVTAIVGPNGCGKSNVVDSIKWVMGEQGARALRGNAMEDVIFNGSEKRGPMGMAEVCLTFENDGSIPIPARFQGLSEIAVERRIERGGGSDYFINRQRCRLADVQELIAGTGVSGGGGGQRAYAIIEQGQIGRVVSAKADDRRVLIEEAAGITRYRTRRRLAEKKIADTMENLERLDVIVREVDTQLKSLRRQAKKAERYKELKAEARDIALHISTFEYLALCAEATHLQAHLDALEIALEDKKRQVEVVETERAARQIEEKANEDVLRRASEVFAVSEAQLKAAKERIEQAEREVVTLKNELQSFQSELYRCKERQSELEGERELARQRIEDLEEQGECEQEELNRLREEQKVAQRKLLDARAAAESLRRQEAEEAHAVATARARKETARRRSIDLREKLEDTEQRRSQVEENRQESREQIELFRADLDQAEAETREAQEALAALQNDVKALQAEQKAANDRDRHFSEEQVALHTRLKGLEELEKRREGFGEGCKAVLAGGLEGVRGAVTDALDIPEYLERAAAAALGEILKGALVDNLETGLKAVRFLQGRGRGRGLFVAAQSATSESFENSESYLPSPPTGAGILGLLSELCPHNEAHALQASLFSRVLVVENAELALSLAQSWPGVLVTLQGERIESGRLLQGGALQGDEAPLSRRREMREIAQAQQSLNEEREKTQTALKEIAQKVRNAELLQEQARRDGHDAEVRQAEARSELTRATKESTKLDQEAVKLAEMVASLRDQCDDALIEVQEAEEALAEIEAGLTDRARQQAEIEEAVMQAEIAKEDAVNAYHQAENEAVARRERYEAARDSANRIERQISDVADRAERAEIAREDRQDRLEALEETRTSLDEAKDAAETAAADASMAVNAAKEAAEASAARVKEVEGELKAARQALEKAQEVVVDQKLQVQACALKRIHLEEDMQKRFQMPLGEILFDHHQRTLPTNEDREHLKNLEQQIERMGEVNLYAIEECAEVEERSKFLTAQRDDLLAALSDLEQAIEEIDKTSRRLFQETFNAVNERFKALFPRLFRGGEAELVLTEPEKLLETGIEMLVCPPGKKVQNVTLLSGGEKAMCAIALIFAVFQVKPSPFCLLDEVDAPLDEANIGRFNEVVVEISRMSQVVIITHNKRTMEIADVLYGVTMEESGISKLVSVRMA